MSREREAVVIEALTERKFQEGLILMAELLTLRRERHRDRLEGSEDPVARGRAKECKDLLRFLS